jgi:hypothetical protein
MATQELLDELRARADEATSVPYKAVKFTVGFPYPHACHLNVKAWVAENPGAKRVRGWLVTSGTIFDKHSVVEENGEHYDITPSNAPGTPFLPYTGSDADFCAIEAQLIVLPEGPKLH